MRMLYGRPTGLPQSKPQYGLPFQEFPATSEGLTPEIMLKREIDTGRKQIQDQFNLQWKAIQQSKRFIGVGKSARMLNELHTKAKQNMLVFNQKAQTKMDQLQSIDRLIDVGGMTEAKAAKIKAGMMYGPKAAEAMYPEKERSIPEQFGKLDVYSHRISQELERFQIVGGKAPSKFLSRLKGISPLATAISTLRGPPKGRKGELRIWDPNIPTKIKDKTTGKMVDAMGDWRKAEPGEIGIYQAWLQEEKDVAARKRELLGQPDISRRRIQPGTKGGTFDDKIAESVRPQQQVKRQPTSTELRQRGTREAYEQGKKLGYWN